jgi:hypothetical protein
LSGGGEPVNLVLSGGNRSRSTLQRRSFVLAFVITQLALDKASEKIARAAEGDDVVWIAYPKGTSKKYECEFNRDSGSSVLAGAGYEPVRQVALDEDGSALRFRKVDFIKSLTRNESRTATRTSEISVSHASNRLAVQS